MQDLLFTALKHAAFSRYRCPTSVSATLLSVLCYPLLPVPPALADPWPAAASGTNIGAGIGAFNTGFEASGLTYHSDHGYIVVGDDGDIAIVQSDVSITAYQMLGGDFEGITVKPHAADLAYVASENFNAILEISLSELSLTGKKWPLDIPQNGGLGFEGILGAELLRRLFCRGNPS